MDVWGWQKRFKDSKKRLMAAGSWRRAETITDDRIVLHYVDQLNHERHKNG